VVHALLDSPSTTGAYRFTIRPGQETIFDVEPVLYPRTEISQAGIAPLTSMFLFDANNRNKATTTGPPFMTPTALPCTTAAMSTYGDN
jgi:periplasmic glucans biosynthesis protein